VHINLYIHRRQARASRDEAEQLAEIKRLLQSPPAASGSEPIQPFGKLRPSENPSPISRRPLKKVEKE